VRLHYQSETLPNAVRKPEGQVTDSMALSGSQVQLKLPLWTALVDVADFGNSKFSRVFMKGRTTYHSDSPLPVQRHNYIGCNDLYRLLVRIDYDYIQNIIQPTLKTNVELNQKKKEGTRTCRVPRRPSQARDLEPISAKPPKPVTRDG